MEKLLSLINIYYIKKILSILFVKLKIENIIEIKIKNWNYYNTIVSRDFLQVPISRGFPSHLFFFRAIIPRACGACKQIQQRRERVAGILKVRARVPACLRACTFSLTHCHSRVRFLSPPSRALTRVHGRVYRRHGHAGTHTSSRPPHLSLPLGPPRSLRRLTPTRCSCSIHT